LTHGCESLMAKTDDKDKTLREAGSLNPRPEGVKDELFVDSEFFDRRDLMQVRYEMLRRVQTEGGSVSETAAQFGLSRPTFYKVRADFEREGLPGLLPRKRGPKDGHKLTCEVVDALRSARDEDPSLSSERLAALVLERFGIEVHRRTVERALAREKKKPR